MQSSDIVLYNLSKQAIKDGFTFDRLYRHLYNEDFYVNALKRIYKKSGSEITESMVDEAAKEKVQEIIESLKNESYQPKEVHRQHIPNKYSNEVYNSQIFTQHIVQEVCQMLLEAIYEQTFSKHAHSFRPKRNCHTALIEIKQTFTGINWFIEGAITDFFANMNHQTLIKILRKRIKDEKFIRLMWKFLKAGVLEDWQLQQTYSGTPKGGIINSILANIYLNEFDEYVESELKSAYEVAKLKNEPYKGIKFVRYAGDFIIGVNGSKEDCIEIKHAMKTFLKEHLQLELSEEKTNIVHSTKLVRFLNYDISISHNMSVAKDKNSAIKSQYKDYVQLRIPKGTVEKIIVKNKMVKNIDAKQWDMLHRPNLVGLPDIKVIEIYNEELSSFYNYYALAENVSRKMWQLHYVMEYSCLKTLANKYKSTVSGMKAKFKQGKHWGVKYETKQGEGIVYFYKDGFKRNKGILQAGIDQLPNVFVYREKHRRK